jgi:hypothetical protein
MSRKSKIEAEKFIFKILPTPSLQEDKESDQLENLLIQAENELKSELFDKISHAHKATGHRLSATTIRFIGERLFTHAVNLVIENPQKEKIRILVRLQSDIEPIETNFASDWMSKGKITHLVEVNITKNKQRYGWHKSDVFSCSVSIAEDQVKDLIKDILLDIAMYNSFPELLTDSKFNLKYVASKKKMEYIEALGMKSKYGPIENGCSYISFASLCYTGHHFNYQDYLRLWRGFVGFLISNHPVLGPFSNCEIFEKNCNKKLPLPFKKGRASLAFNQVPAGKYYVIQLIKKPKSHNSKERLLSLFGGTAVKLGRIKIIPLEHYNIIKPCAAVLGMFRFDKLNQ